MRLAHVAVLAALLLAPMAVQAAEGDGLKAILVEGDEWQAVAQGLGFADGGAPDSEGNFYFADLKKPAAIYKLAPDGTKTKIADVGMSGLKIGPDGRLYGCGGGKVSAFDLPGGKENVIITGMAPNDLVVSHAGQIFITETGKHQVTRLDVKSATTQPADVGISKPNGIGLSPDQKTLLVSDYGGINVWTFTIAADGTLSNKKPAMTMKAPEAKPGIAGGDGMTVDTAGRAYVTTALGVQVFAADGALLGIIPKPQDGPLTNVGFAGEGRAYLYATCGTKVFRRKTQAKGLLYFEPPLNTVEAK